MNKRLVSELEGMAEAAYGQGCTLDGDEYARLAALARTKLCEHKNIHRTGSMSNWDLVETCKDCGKHLCG